MKFLKASYTPDFRTRRIISLAAWSGIAVFFFILLFQPFELPEAELTETLFLVAGMGLISFLSPILVLVLVPWFLPKWFLVGEWEEGPPDLLNLAVWVISTTAMAFYIRYVADRPLSIPVVVRIALVCLAPSIFFRVNMRITSLRWSIEAHKKPNIQQTHLPIPVVEIFSDNGSESVEISSDRLLYIKAADNYVEVIRQENGEIRSRLIRTTLKKVSMDLTAVPEILQCHRAYIINTKKVEKLHRSSNGYTIVLKGVPENIPVSRAYQIRVREALKLFRDR